MRFDELERLLDPTPMALEMGFERLPAGVLHVAIRTDMNSCTGAMLEWWFGTFRPGTREYIWWHPLDHIESAWAEGVPGTHIGSIHHVTERFTDGDPEQLAIQFRDPSEFFDPDALGAARASGAVSGVLCAHGGQGPTPVRNSNGAVVGTRLVHLCRDTPRGMVLRTHFFLGHDFAEAGLSPSAIETHFPTTLAPRLLQHCYDEFSSLASFLPALYAAENRNKVPVVRHW